MSISDYKAILLYLFIYFFVSNLCSKRVYYFLLQLILILLFVTFHIYCVIYCYGKFSRCSTFWAFWLFCLVHLCLIFFNFDLFQVLGAHPLLMVRQRKLGHFILSQIPRPCTWIHTLGIEVWTSYKSSLEVSMIDSRSLNLYLINNY